MENNILANQIEKLKIQQILGLQETMLEDLIEYRNDLYSLSYSVGRKKQTYGNISREYIREPYSQLTTLIESTRKNINKIKDRIYYLESGDLRKIH